MKKRIKDGVVYVVLPIYNGIDMARRCIRLLLDQSYKHLVIVVSDGNSSDKTPDLLSSDFPEIIILRSKKTLWWGGSMQKGVEYVLEDSHAKNDFVLMMNIDTEFSKDYIYEMVKASIAHDAVVGSLIVDIKNPKKIIDAGVKIDWKEFSFTGKNNVIDGEICRNNVDTLPGRGTIVPIEVIRDVGNINAKKFPHYIADYEYFCRIKKYGYKLVVTYETKLFVHSDNTGLRKSNNLKNNIFNTMYHKLSRRSARNIFDHYNFIDSAAPDEMKDILKRRFLPKKVRRIFYFLEKIGIK